MCVQISLLLTSNVALKKTSNAFEAVSTSIEWEAEFISTSRATGFSGITAIKDCSAVCPRVCLELQGREPATLKNLYMKQGYFLPMILVLASKRRKRRGKSIPKPKAQFHRINSGNYTGKDVTISSHSLIQCKISLVCISPSSLHSEAT